MANLLRMTVTGDDVVQARLRALADRAHPVVDGALFTWGKDVMAESQEQFVPVDTGVLRASGHVVTPRRSKGPVSAEAAALTAFRPESVTVALGYGGPACAYALSVHENPRSGRTGGVSPSGRPYAHWATVGQWKYLETPFKAWAPMVPRYIAAAIQTAERTIKSLKGGILRGARH